MFDVSAGTECAVLMRMNGYNRYIFFIVIYVRFRSRFERNNCASERPSTELRDSCVFNKRTSADHRMFISESHR